MIIKVSTAFSRFPGGRYPSDGSFCGQTFREDILVPALKAGHKKIIIDISGVEGMGSSFIDEAFGGLIRENHFNPGELTDRIEVVYDDDDLEFYAGEIYSSLKGA